MHASAALLLVAAVCTLALATLPSAVLAVQHESLVLSEAYVDAELLAYTPVTDIYRVVACCVETKYATSEYNGKPLVSCSGFCATVHPQIIANLKHVWSLPSDPKWRDTIAAGELKAMQNRGSAAPQSQFQTGSRVKSKELLVERVVNSKSALEPMPSPKARVLAAAAASSVDKPAKAKAPAAPKKANPSKAAKTAVSPAAAAAAAQWALPSVGAEGFKALAAAQAANLAGSKLPPTPAPRPYVLPDRPINNGVSAQPQAIRVGGRGFLETQASSKMPTTTRLWPNNRVPYAWSAGMLQEVNTIPDLLTDGHITPRWIVYREYVDGIRAWESATGITFWLRPAVADGVVELQSNTVPEHHSNTVGEPAVGNTRPYVTLGTTGRFAGTGLHELGHVLGFGHTHQRPDRGDYITDNTDSNACITYLQGQCPGQQASYAYKCNGRNDANVRAGLLAKVQTRCMPTATAWNSALPAHMQLCRTTWCVDNFMRQGMDVLPPAGWTPGVVEYDYFSIMHYGYDACLQQPLWAPAHVGHGVAGVLTASDKDAACQAYRCGNRVRFQGTYNAQAWRMDRYVHPMTTIDEMRARLLALIKFLTPNLEPGLAVFGGAQTVDEFLAQPWRRQGDATVHAGGATVASMRNLAALAPPPGDPVIIVQIGA